MQLLVWMDVAVLPRHGTDASLVSSASKVKTIPSSNEG